MRVGSLAVRVGWLGEGGVAIQGDKNSRRLVSGKMVWEGDDGAVDDDGVGNVRVMVSDT